MINTYIYDYLYFFIFKKDDVDFLKQLVLIIYF